MTHGHAFGLIQLTPSFPLGPSLCACDIPEFGKAFDTVPPYDARIIAHRGSVPHRLAFHISRLSSKYQTAFLRFQRLDDPLTNLQLGVPAEKMQEAGGVYEVYFPLQLVQSGIFF